MKQHEDTFSSKPQFEPQPQPFPPMEFGARCQAHNFTEADIPRLIATIRMIAQQAKAMTLQAMNGRALDSVVRCYIKAGLLPLRVSKVDVKKLSPRSRLQMRETATEIIIEYVEPNNIVSLPSARSN